MNKRQINEEIALYFKFEKSEKHLIDGKLQWSWSFPKGFPLHQCCVPNLNIPDFIQILEDYMMLMEKHGAESGYPRQWPWQVCRCTDGGC